MNVNCREKKQRHLLSCGANKKELNNCPVKGNKVPAQEEVTLPSIYSKELFTNTHDVFFSTKREKTLLVTSDDLAAAIKSKDDKDKLIEELQQVCSALEQQVAVRTAELNQKNNKLEETKVALNVILQKREEGAKELEENILFNVEKLISPYLEKLTLECSNESQKKIIKNIQSNLKRITSSFAPERKGHLARLTPTQIQIADLIRHGHATKEIASILNLSPSTVSCHRQDIRKRLSLNNKKINLQTALN